MINNSFVFEKIKALAQQVAPKGSLVIMFGSRARGDAKQDSDWDILIVLPKKSLVQADYDEVSYPLVELGWELNEQINPIKKKKNEWEANSITPFYDNVQREGIKLVA